ncbi:MAG: aminotransferase class I/II-fold pyridoxal phosphate-dependent enzyme [Lachnospiraceae bacterium]|nr:aminotransferase class I/II-fold pyridoxal phosphate-dependent enzyme [Lachnospiraceae bacterium]
MYFKRMKIEQESPEEFGYGNIKYNLTESSTTDKTMKDVGIVLPEDTLLCYGDHYGNEKLRELLAKEYGVSKDNIIITVGACMAVFTIYSALLNPGDHVIVMHPNYPADIDITHSLGCNTEYYRLKQENGFKFDVDELASMIKPETKLVNITYPHNPTGTVISEADLRKIVKICEEKKIHILVDETYGDLTVGPRTTPRAASLSPYAISIESLSKAIGVPGIRTGWIASGDDELIMKLIAAKEQICICGSVVDEECAYQVLSRREELMAPIKEDIAVKFAIVKEFMASQDVLDWVEPEGGVVCFPWIKPEIDLDVEEYHKVLNEKYGVFIGPGHWFDFDDRHFRVGYAWPSVEELKAGLQGLVDAVKDVRKN